MTLFAFWANTGQKRLNMVAILKIKMAAEDALEKNGSNSGFVLKGIWSVKSIGSASIANFALYCITPCTLWAVTKARFTLGCWTDEFLKVA